MCNSPEDHNLDFRKSFLSSDLVLITELHSRETTQSESELLTLVLNDIVKDITRLTNSLSSFRKINFICMVDFTEREGEKEIQIYKCF